MSEENTSQTAPNLCDVLGVEAGEFSRFLNQKEEALETADQASEKRVKDALLSELVWPQ